MERRSRYSEYFPTYLLVATFCLLTVLDAAGGNCNFEYFLHNSNGSTWETRITFEGDGTKRVMVQARKNVMMARVEHQTSYGTTSNSFYTRKCITKMSKSKYIVKHEREGERVSYACLEFVGRSQSILQLKYSEFRPQLDLRLCEDSRLKISPWPLLLRSKLKDEYVGCPLKGGYNMKLRNYKGLNNGCNFKALPMRFESECIAGEGIIFDFRSAACLQGVPMETLTTTLCITSWSHGGYTFTVLRSTGENEMVWCLRTSSESGDHITAHLFTDFICPSSHLDSYDVNYVTLTLERFRQLNTCQDEYSECAEMECNSYIAQECPKSCKKCDPHMPPPICSFPSMHRGKWFQRDPEGGKSIEVSETDFSIESVGSFKCVVLGDNFNRDTGKYTVVSLFTNGCRPRYTCLKVKQITSSVMGYSLSRSHVWPLFKSDMADAICRDQRFFPDLKPIRDTYRSFPDTLKPIVSQDRSLEYVDCGFLFSYRVRIPTRRPGVNCHGRMFEDCVDHSKLRIETSNCPVHREFVDYYCISTFRPHYWEKVVLLQNRDNSTDVVCLIFSEVRDTQVLLMAASQCDKHSWAFVNAGIRKPIEHYNIEPDDYPCGHVPVRSTTELTQIPVTRMRRPNETPSPATTFSVPIKGETSRAGKYSVLKAYPTKKSGFPIVINPERSSENRGSTGIVSSATVFVTLLVMLVNGST